MTAQSPRYKHYDLGKQPPGTIVEIVLSAINNVRLIDDRNYGLYQTGKAYKFLGGLAVKSPTKLVVPSADRWHLVVDREGLPKLANSNVRTIQPGAKLARVQQADATDPQRTDADADPLQQPAPAGLANSAGEHSAAVMDDILRELQQYKQIANTDALTGLSNRRAFDEKLDSVFASAHTHPAALIISDVDHFKKFNDTHGHIVGDQVLKIVADLLSEHAAHDVFVARTGGEEFAMIIEGRHDADVLRLADSVRTALAERPFTDETARMDYGRITMSMGICMKCDAGDPSEIYAKADSALYVSKRNGRNRCTLFTPSRQAAG